MASDQFPKRQSSSKDISHFLDTADQLPQRSSSQRQQSGRLIFALDATASRQPSWDRACQLQAQMFQVTQSIGGLSVQLCYYRGFNEFYATAWHQDSHSLLQTMTGVHCLGGYTQIERILHHSIREHQQQSVNAVIFIGDAMEENIDKLCAKAGELGILGVPLFMFQEGDDPVVRNGFKQMATVSHGAYAPFNEYSANQLADLLAAVATYATGGYDALQQVQSTAAKQLLEQLKR